MPIPKEAPPTQRTGLQFAPVRPKSGERIVIYGLPKLGKTSLALSAPGRTVFFDLDDSLPALRASVDTVPVENYDDIYNALNAPGWEGVDNIVIDGATALEILAANDAMQKVRTKTGQEAKSIEAYGYGQGYRLVYERVDRILMALENHARQGRNTILICHETTRTVSNAMGEDYLQYAPALLETKSIKLINRVVGWADHILFVAMDTCVNGNKSESSGTRAIYHKINTMYVGGSRTIQATHEIPYEKGCTKLWDELHKTP